MDYGLEFRLLGWWFRVQSSGLGLERTFEKFCAFLLFPARLLLVRTLTVWV